MPGGSVAPIEIPDHFTVWAATDVHGQLQAVDRLLAEAGLTDGAGTWIAPPATALVVTGDVVDRGPIRSAWFTVSRRCGSRPRPQAAWSPCSRATTRCRSSVGWTATRICSARS